MAGKASDHVQANSPRCYSYTFRISHWVLLVSSVILIATGASLHAAARPDWSIFCGAVPSWLWRGRMHVWHYWAAVAFLPAVLICLPMLLQKVFWGRATRVILIGGSGLLALTGLWMLFPWGTISANKTVVAMHAALGLLVFPTVLLWHMIAGVTQYSRNLGASFRVWREVRLGAVIGLGVVAVLSTWIMFEGWPLQVSWRNLIATRIPAPTAESTSDNKSQLADLPWEKTTPLSVLLVGGSGFSSGHTDMTLRALHDGEQLYIKAQWDDPSENYGYWPWKKRDDRWEYVQTSEKDEITQYEDKFSMVFPTAPSWHFEQVGCAMYCHVDGKYGWGYKGGQPDIDAWHWKAARTGSVGQVDDKYWSTVDFTTKTIGRLSDPSDGGGFVKNVSEDGNQPLYLPDDWQNVHQGSIPDEHKVAFDADSTETFPVGTVLPGIISAPFQGDRGDVLCQSTYENQQWTLYIKRKLDTGSDHDAKFAPGGTFAFGCAAFDHAGKRHARSVPVLHLVLEE
jgi:hypothetical protein